MSSPAVSIVICFRDWGLDRLVTAVRSHFINAEVAGLDIEVIVSDYGSNDAAAVAAAVEPLRAKVVRTETSEPWSRAAALNAGVRATSAPYVITTDADVVFTPSALSEFLEQAKSHPDVLHLIQCRDLPFEYDKERIDALNANNWKEQIALTQAHATIRPRWGMGGFAGFSRALFDVLNGYDERMKIWGGEDNDFAQRARWAGFPNRWLSRHDVSILHLWHEPSREKAADTEAGRAAIEKNRQIVKKDRTLHRNLPHRVASSRGQPLISIIIPTYRRAHMLREALASCLAQTFEDFEVLVVENGDSHEAESIVEGFGDPRIRYFATPKTGPAAARNYGLEHAVGRYVVIHDDDDVMVSTRLEDHLTALSSGDHGTYGGWIDFEDETFEVAAKHPGKEFSFESVLCNGKVLTHGALMLDRRVFSMFRYEESLDAGIDYGLILLLSRHGLRLAHTGKYAILRRLHRRNITATRMDSQKSAARRMADVIKAELGDRRLSECRARAKDAKLLSCSNEADALKELEKLKLEALRCGSTEAVLRAEDFGGGSMEALLAHIKKLDAQLAHQIFRRGNTSIRVSGFSDSATAFVRLRTIHLANSTGREAPPVSLAP